MTDFRALCAELLRSLENYPIQPSRDRDLCLRARAALAEQPVELSDKELWAIWDPHDGPIPAVLRAAIAADRAVLARWGQPATPIPVAERLPFAKCDEDQKCWWYEPEDEHWCLASQFVARLALEATHWLPANALPVPAHV